MSKSPLDNEQALETGAQKKRIKQYIEEANQIARGAVMYSFDYSKALTLRQEIIESAEALEIIKSAEALEIIKSAEALKTRKYNEILYNSIKDGRFNEVNRLISTGSKVNAIDEYDKTPLDYAAEKGNSDIIKSLVENGAHVTPKMFELISTEVLRPHFIAALWCHNIRTGQIEELEDATTRAEISLLRQIMIGQLAEEGSMKSLNQVLNVDNPTVKSIIETKHFENHARMAILHKYAASIHNSIFYGESYDKPGLDALSEEEQDYVVNKVKSLCKDFSIGDSYDNPIKTLESSKDAIPERMREELGKSTDDSIRDEFFSTEEQREASQRLNLQGRINAMKHATDVCTKDNYWNKPLHYAASLGDLLMVEFLLEPRANVNEQNQDIVKDLLKHCYGKYTAKLLKASKISDYKAAIKATKDNARIDATIGEDELTPLHYASINGNLAIIESFLKHGAHLNGVNKYGWTALHCATKYGNLNVIEFLLNYGAHVNFQDKSFKTPLHYLADQNVGNEFDSTGLYYRGPEKQRLKMIELLLNYNADVTIEDCDHKTALHYASKSGYLEVVKRLHEKGADIHAKDIEGKKPFNYANEFGKLEVVKYLCEKGVDVHEEDQYGNTALHYASKYGNLECVKYLHEKGANVNAVNTNDKQPIHCASKYGNLEVIKYLLEKGADVNAANRNGEQPIHYAIKSAKSYVIKYLVENNANVNAKFQNGLTPIQFCFNKNWISLELILIRNGATVTPDMIDLMVENAATVTSGMRDLTENTLLRHFIAAKWCENALANSSYEDIPEYSLQTELPIIKKVMKGQLKLRGSIEKLMEAKTNENAVMKRIFTKDFVNDVGMAIVEKRKTVPELYKSIESGDYADNLTNLPENAQKNIANQLKDLLRIKPFIGDYQKLKSFSERFGNQIGKFLSSKMSTLADQIKTDRTNLAQDFERFLDGKLVLDATEIYDEIDASETKTDKEAADSFLKTHNTNPKKPYEFELSSDLRDPSNYLLNPDLIDKITEKMNNLALSQENYKGRDNDISFYEFLNGPILDEKSKLGFLNNLDKHFLPRGFNLKARELRNIIKECSMSTGIENVRNMMTEEVTKMSSNIPATKIQKTDIVYDAHNKLADQEMDVEHTRQTPNNMSKRPLEDELVSQKKIKVLSESVGIQSVRNMMTEEKEYVGNNAATKIQKINIVYDACQTQQAIEAGVDINAKDKKNLTRLQHALINKQTDVLEILLENGARVDQRLLKVVTSLKALHHLSAGLWCQNARMGQIDKLPSTLGEDPILLLTKIMKGQLVEGGSIETLNQLQQSDNPTIQNIINIDNFVGKTTEEIIEKHAARFYSSILYGKAHDKPGLDTLSLEQQDVVVNKVKLLCGGITIDNENLSKVFEGNSVPEHMKQELQQFFCTNEGGAPVSSMEVESEVVDELSGQKANEDPAAGNNHGSNAPMDIDFSGQALDMHGDNPL